MTEITRHQLDPNNSINSLLKLNSIAVPNVLKPSVNIFMDEVKDASGKIGQFPPELPDPCESDRALDDIFESMHKAVDKYKISTKKAIENATTESEKNQIFLVTAGSAVFFESFLGSITEIFKKIKEFILRGYRRIKNALTGIFSTLYSSLTFFFK